MLKSLIKVFYMSPPSRQAATQEAPASAGPVMPVSPHLLAVHPISPGRVELAGGFWGDRQRQNREITIPHGMRMLEESGALENLRIAAGTSTAEYKLPVFRDSDLYKVLEAIAWERSHGADPDQAARLILRLARGCGDHLSGRHLTVTDDLDGLLSRIDEIQREDLHTLRLRH